MTPEEFERLARAIVGDLPTWQAEIARKLGVNRSTIRRIAGGAPIPEGLTQDLIELMPWLSRDEWIVGDGQDETAPDRRREYLIHTAWPRFIARIVKLDELAGQPEPGEGEVQVSGLVYERDPETWLCEFQWIDKAPAGEELRALLTAADTALMTYFSE